MPGVSFVFGKTMSLESGPEEGDSGADGEIAEGATGLLAS